MQRSRTVFVGVTRRAATTTSCGSSLGRRAVLLALDPLADIKARLDNWGRACKAAMPDLDYSPPPVYDFIYATLGKGKGKTKDQEEAEAESGTTSDTDDDAVDKINHADAELVGDLLWRLGVGPHAPDRFPVGRVHFMVIKRHYYNKRHQPRDMLDAACRAFGDLLG